jgi:hypothetical protein
MEFLQLWFAIVTLFGITIWGFRHYHIRSLLQRIKDEVRYYHFTFPLTDLYIHLIFPITSEIIRLRSADFPEPQTSQYSSVDTKDPSIDPYHIEPLPSFNWRTTPPLKFRNFKPKYHLTMGKSSLHSSFPPHLPLILPRTNGPHRPHKHNIL